MLESNTARRLEREHEYLAFYQNSALPRLRTRECNVFIYDRVSNFLLDTSEIFSHSCLIGLSIEITQFAKRNLFAGKSASLN